MTTPTHDLAIARAERDAWQSTCEELHRTIAGRDVEIEAHLGRIEAADQRARSFDAALTAEREAGKGLVAQVDTLRAAAEENRGALVDVADSLHVNTLGVSSTDVATRCGVAIAKLRFELAAIRDLVAPGNPQGTVVDAVRAMATGLIESIGARDAAEQARDMARDSRDAAIARAEAAERTLSGLYDDSKAELAKLRAELAELRMGYVDVCDAIAAETHGPAHAASIARETRQERDRLRAELAELTVTRDRLLAREHEDGRLHAQLRAEVAELRERPVLTEDLLRGALDAHGHAALTRKLFAHLGPVTLPSPDRLATLESHLRDIHSGADDAEAKEAWLYCAELINAEARALAKLSPAPAPTFDAAFLRRVMVATKHGPNGKGGPGPCDAACVKCEAERMVKAAPAREVAPTLVAVSDEELVAAFAQAHLECPCDESGEEWAKYPPNCCNAAGARAVRAKLGAAEVTEVRLARAIGEAYGHAAPEFVRAAWNHLRATAAKDLTR